MRKSFFEHLSLKGRTTLITGGAGHVGEELCHAFAELGSNIIIVDVSQEKMQILVQQLKALYKIDAVFFQVDLEQEQQRQTMIEDVTHYLQKNKRPLNILINNAAFVGTSNIQGWNVPFAEQSLETWRRVLEVNLTACFHLCQGFAPLLTQAPKQTQGIRSNIINIGSIYGHMPPEWSLYENTSMNNPVAYAVSKAGLHGLTTWLSSTLAPEVRVNTISPGGIERGQDPVFMERYNKMTNTGKMSSELSIAQMVFSVVIH